MVLYAKMFAILSDAHLTTQSTDTDVFLPTLGERDLLEVAMLDSLLGMVYCGFLKPRLPATKCS